MNSDKLEKKRQKKQEVYEYLLSFTRKKGYPPAVREICKELSIKSTSTVHSFLKDLEIEGLIKRDPTKPRAIEIPSLSSEKGTSEIVNIPIIGRIAAGIPILAEENREDIFPISLSHINAKDDLFILKISGDSMIDMGVMNGDYVIIEKCDIVPNGTVTAVLIDNEATLKTFYKEKDYIRLQPENKTMTPILVKDCSILGKLVALYRKY